MRVRSAVRKLCEACKIVKRRGKVYVICKSSGKHKQRQGFHTQTAAQAEQAMQQQVHAQPQHTDVLSNVVRAPAPQQLTSGLGEMLWRQKSF